MRLLGPMLRHSRLNIVKEAAWTISNITAGNSGQIQKVLEAGLMEPLLHVLQTVSGQDLFIQYLLEFYFLVG